MAAAYDSRLLMIPGWPNCSNEATNLRTGHALSIEDAQDPLQTTVSKTISAGNLQWKGRLSGFQAIVIFLDH